MNGTRYFNFSELPISHLSVRHFAIGLLYPKECT